MRPYTEDDVVSEWLRCRFGQVNPDLSAHPERFNSLVGLLAVYSLLHKATMPRPRSMELTYGRHAQMLESTQTPAYRIWARDHAFAFEDVFTHLESLAENGTIHTFHEKLDLPDLKTIALPKRLQRKK